MKGEVVKMKVCKKHRKIFLANGEWKEVIEMVWNMAISGAKEEKEKIDNAECPKCKEEYSEWIDLI